MNKFDYSFYIASINNGYILTTTIINNESNEIRPQQKHYCKGPEDIFELVKLKLFGEPVLDAVAPNITTTSGETQNEED